MGINFFFSPTVTVLCGQNSYFEVLYKTLLYSCPSRFILHKFKQADHPKQQKDL